MTFSEDRRFQRQPIRSVMDPFGALLADTTSQTIQAALENSGTKDVYQWCKDHLGTTLFGKRKLAFADGATKDG